MYLWEIQFNHMKKTLWILVAALAALVSCSGNGNGNKEEEEKTDPAAALAGKDNLTEEEAATYSAYLQKEWKAKTKKNLQSVYDDKEIIIGGKKMPLHWSVYGSQPGDGRSLYISLHGGGGTTPDVNDQQWDNQKRLYKPSEGVYLCPRAIDNTWDMHFMNGTDAFYEKIIALAESFFNVNPDKVYLMGYSAGGDGVWRLAPRMADHWAAASMMAGHPGDVSLVNLRNTPFMIWCGAEDSAYERNLRCQERIAEMQALHDADPEGYDFEGHILEGYGHWMELKDAAAVPWMAARKRNPYPGRIVWRQEEGLREYFYWIKAPSSEIARGKEVVAELSDNTVTLTKCDYSSLTLYFNDKMADLDRPVKVVCEDKLLFEGILQRKSSTLESTLKSRGDLSFMFPAEVTVTKYVATP